MLLRCNYLWSMDTNVRSSLCLLLNITSFCGISSSDGGPKGVQMAKSARGGSSVLRFCPWRTLIRPRISKRYNTMYNNTWVNEGNVTVGETYRSERRKCLNGDTMHRNVNVSEETFYMVTHKRHNWEKEISERWDIVKDNKSTWRNMSTVEGGGTCYRNMKCK